MMAFCKLTKNQKKFLPPVPAAIRNRPMYAKALKQSKFALKVK